MFFQNLWTNWKTGVKNIGNTINKHLPSVFKGAKTVSSWLQATGIPGVVNAAQLADKVIDVASAAHTYFNKGNPGNQRPGTAGLAPGQDPLD